MVASGSRLTNVFTGAQAARLVKEFGVTSEPQAVGTGCNLGIAQAVYPTYSSATCKTRHVAAQECVNIQLVYNALTGNLTTPEIPFTNPYEIKCSLEIDGVLYPVYWANGRRLMWMTPGVTVISEPVGVRLTQGQVFYVRTFFNRIISNTFTTANGETGNLTANQTNLPYGTLQRGAISGSGEGVTFSVATGVDPFLQDVTDSGTITQSSNLCYYPCAILGQNNGTKKKSCLLVGDSIMLGTIDTAYPNDVSTGNGKGFGMRALGDTVASVWFAYGGNQVQNMLTNQYTFSKERLGATCGNALIELGTNDIASGARTGAQVFADLQTFLAKLPPQIQNKYLCTILPRSTSSDNWLTTTGQVTQPFNNFNNERITLNNLIRSSGIPYFDIADAVESSRNSGVWKAPTTPAYSSTSTGFTATTCTDGAANWAVNQWVGYTIIVSGQSYPIFSNTATVLTIGGTLSPVPGAATAYTLSLNWTHDGVHPTPYGHIQMAAAINANAFG